MGESPYLSCRRDQILKNERVYGQTGIPPKRGTSPTWVPHLHVKVEVIVTKVYFV